MAGREPELEELEQDDRVDDDEYDLEADDDALEDVDEGDESDDEDDEGDEDEGDGEDEEEQEDEGDRRARDEDDGSEQASLEELLDQRAAARRGSDDDDDESDIMSFPGNRERRVDDRLPSRVTPMRDRQEFVCKRCYLVKPKVQLADPARGLCRDCV